MIISELSFCLIFLRPVIYNSALNLEGNTIKSMLLSSGQYFMTVIVRCIFLYCMVVCETKMNFVYTTVSTFGITGMGFSQQRSFPSWNYVEGHWWGKYILLNFCSKSWTNGQYQSISASILQVVKLGECEIYSYNPDSEEDPYFEKGAM